MKKNENCMKQILMS